MEEARTHSATRSSANGDKEEGTAPMEILRRGDGANGDIAKRGRRQWRYCEEGTAPMEIKKRGRRQWR